MKKILLYYGVVLAMLLLQSCSTAGDATPTSEQSSVTAAVTSTVMETNTSVPATSTPEESNAPTAAPTQETSTEDGTISAVVILAPAGLNIRTQPSTASEVIGVLPQNEVVNVSGVNPEGDWWQIACPDGSADPCWITADPQWSEPVKPAEYSLSGLVYSLLDDQSERQLWRVGADGNPTIFLERSQGLAALSPDGQQGINCCLPRGETNLYLIDLETDESLQLTNTAERLNFNPQWWQQNLDTIIFMSKNVDSSAPPSPGPSNLAAVKTDGTGFQVLDDDHLMHNFPALAPDGQTIAYNHGGESAAEDGVLTPWLFNQEDGAAPFEYAQYGLESVPGLSFGTASWSPDGKYLAWVIGGDLLIDGQWQTGIAMFDLVGLSVEILNTYTPADCLFVWCRVAPNWSPDGLRLTWEVTPANGLPSFVIMGPDGSDERLIDHAAGPMWSPDGNLLIYTQLSTGAVMVMEVGRWQPQPTNLPNRSVAFHWIIE